MAIEWDQNAINSMVSQWVNTHAERVNQIAQSHLGGDIPTEVSFATPDEMLVSIGAGPESLVREYGNMNEQPRPWGIVSLMEASNAVQADEVG